MASARTRAWGPTHPSAAFLIKCAKEKEKLKSTLQKQLQDHMLHMLQECLFSDILIGVNSGKYSQNESKASTHPDLPELLHTHKSILKVRTPAFLEGLEQHQETNLGVTSYNSFLEESELRHFLRKIYTDDDIRKHECEALRMTRLYKEILCQRRGPINKHITDVDEFEKESVNSCCTDNFVTPKTSPISPEKGLEVSEMFKAAQNHEMEEGSIIGPSSKSVHNANIGHSSVVGRRTSESDISDMEFSRRLANIDLLLSDADISGKSEEEDNVYAPLIDVSSSRDSDDDDGESSIPDDVSNMGSMVRSSTFDLQTQGSLEDVADDELQWCSGHQLDDDYKIEENHNFEAKNETVASKKIESNGFFLHDHTPSPKSNIFKHGFIKEVSFNNNHDMDNSIVHLRRVDGSLTDSGFMSHSTFSLLSDTGLPSSVSSSLILSSDGTVSPSARSTSTGNDIQSSDQENSSKRFSGSMFPFYIDINNLPPGAPVLPKEKKLSSPSHTYMYIDARSKKVIDNDNEFVREVRKQTSVNSSYEAFFSELEAGFEGANHERLLKASSSPHLDLYQETRFDSGRSSKSDKRSRPQSCYMYIDLDSIKDNKNCLKKHPTIKSSPSSVSMFIDLNDASNTNISSDVKQSIEPSKNLNMTNFSQIKNIQQDSKSANEQFLKHNSKFLDRKSDVSVTNQFQQQQYDPKSQSLNRHRDSRSASALEYRIVNFQDIAAQSKLTSYPEKYYGAHHRYSDGFVYDNSLNSVSLYSNDSLDVREEKLSNDAKNIEIKDTKFFNQAVKMQLMGKHEESSGSCSNLGRFNLNSQLLADDKVKWKSTGDMGQSKESDTKLEGGLLPMSPILRRKTQPKDVPKPTPPPVVVKASTKPQDIDAMTFPKSLKEEGQNHKSSQENICTEPVIASPPTMHKKQDHLEDSKSSSDSLKLVSEGVSESSDQKEKMVDSMSRSGSSLMTVSGGDTSSSDKNITHEISKLHCFYDFEDDSETIYSEVSDVSSSLGGFGGIASLEQRWKETQSADSDIKNENLDNSRRILEACSKLGEDLLRMFLEEIDTDIKIEVAGHQINAHRCILASRCKYFASLLRGSDSRKNCSTISLEGFSQTSVHFALCHIYSGAMNIPKDCNISELALLADMLSLDSLTDVIVFHLKMHYCHFFHRPCPQCIQGVTECLPLAAVCGLNELRDKCIFWLGKYFTRTWPNKAFSALSEELRNLCYNVTVLHLAVDSVIDITLSCDRLITTLPQLKWTEPIFGMVTKLLQDCIHFMAKNFSQILCSEGFLALGKGQSWNITALEEDIISSVDLTTPDVACKSYVKVNQLLLFTEIDEKSEFGEFTQNFVDLLHKISRHCERYLIQNANKVVHCQSWACLSPQVQKRIKDAAVIVFEFEKPTAPPPRLSSLHRKLKKQNDADEMVCLERSTYPKKGRNIHIRKFHRDPSTSPKNGNAPYKPENSDCIYQRREMESLIKKVVSPIKEEAQSSSVDQSLRDVSHDRLSEYESPVVSHVSHNRGYVDLHEEDSLRDLQDLPQDRCSQSPSYYLRSLHGGDVLDVESHSPIQCSDNNPDSLEANEEMSSEDKADIRNEANQANKFFEPTSNNLSVEDLKKGRNVKMSSETKSNLVQESKVPILHPVLPYDNGNKQSQNLIKCDKSPVKKSSATNSFVPLAKVHNGEDKKLQTEDKRLQLEDRRLQSENRTKDLVAEIDADSRMVNHCLQEAEMLEQQLSRKLQRQHQDRSPNTVVDYHRSSRTGGSRLQKASSTSQIKSLASAPRSPGRGSKSTASSPSIGHAPRLLRSADLSNREQKFGQRKVLLSPKGNVVASPQRSYRAMDNVASVHRQVAEPSKRKLSGRTKVPNIVNGRTSIPNGK